MKDWQIKVYLKFISKGEYLAARVFFTTCERESKLGRY